MENDKLRCAGSFRTVGTDCAGTEYNRDANGQLKIQVICPYCKRLVGLRAQLRNSRGVLAQHFDARNQPDTVIGQYGKKR